MVDPASSAVPQNQAAAWLVADLADGKVLAAKNAHGAFAPASALKTLTALTLVPDLDPAATYTATPADMAIDGSKVGLSAGSVYTVDDLVHGLMLGSGNDCANALATLSGGMPKAVERMNAKAAELGALDTHAVNTSGLDAPGQVSSVHDLAIFGRALLKDPYLAQVVGTKFYDFPDKGTSVGPDRKRFQIQNHDKLLRNYEGATGVKNGYTKAAKGSFIGSATRSGRSFVAVVINSEGNTWHESRDLLDYAFADASILSVGDLDTAGEQAQAAAEPDPVQEGLSGLSVGAAGAASDAVTTATGRGTVPWPALLGGGAGILLAAVLLALLMRRPPATPRRARNPG